jgi:hypothetical protein
MRKLSENKHKQYIGIHVGKVMDKQIYNQKKRERRSSATVAGNELFEYKLKPLTYR